MRGLAFFSFGFLSVLIALYIYWRFIWIFRNPLRKIPSGDHIVSPADGTVIHAKRLDPDEKAISVDRNVQLSINDIVGEDLRRPVILIGICMSPFDVQYIRSPLTGTIELIRHPPPALRNFRMGSMCWKILMRRSPFHRNSIRILQNERKVITKITGRFAENPLSCYVIQIAAKTVSVIDSYYPEGSCLRKGHIFGMTRIGTQVEMVIQFPDDLEIKVRPEERVRSGETVIVTAR